MIIVQSKWSMTVNWKWASVCMGEKPSQLAFISFETCDHLKTHLQPLETETQSTINDVQDMNHPQFCSANTCTCFHYAMLVLFLLIMFVVVHSWLDLVHWSFRMEDSLLVCVCGGGCSSQCNVIYDPNQLRLVVSWCQVSLSYGYVVGDVTSCFVGECWHRPSDSAPGASQLVASLWSGGLSHQISIYWRLAQLLSLATDFHSSDRISDDSYSRIRSTGRYILPYKLKSSRRRISPPLLHAAILTLDVTKM